LAWHTTTCLQGSSCACVEPIREAQVDASPRPSFGDPAEKGWLAPAPSSRHRIVAPLYRHERSSYGQAHEFVPLRLAQLVQKFELSRRRLYVLVFVQGPDVHGIYHTHTHTHTPSFLFGCFHALIHKSTQALSSFLLAALRYYKSIDKSVVAAFSITEKLVVRNC